ncbi:unnamed protein product [Rotaria socialis]|uniref:Uncharacterized protein n=1 Tax=Rotaria socialis TaxID=392032 RepID=A0A821CI25_9BILA|nr:unnamed protein product [Rotaria socialis]CAF4852163.1 unnamed protein product [Rotaria socialis]
MKRLQHSAPIVTSVKRNRSLSRSKVEPNPISSQLNERVLPSRTESIAKPTKALNKSNIVSESKISFAVDEYSFLTSNRRPSPKPYPTNSFDSSTTSNRTQHGGRWLPSSKTKIILLLVIFLIVCAAIILPPVLTMVIFGKKKTSGKIIVVIQKS